MGLVEDGRREEVDWFVHVSIYSSALCNPTKKWILSMCGQSVQCSENVMSHQRGWWRAGRGVV